MIPERSGLDFGGYTALYLLLLLILGWRVTLGLEQHMDVLLWDEANYLNRGLWMFDKIPKVWGPSYSAWYKVLSYIEPDKISLYYLNYKIMTIGSALIAFLFLSVCGVRQWISFLICTCLLLSSFNLPVWPKISHYCILIAMLAVIASRYLTDVLAKWCIFSLALLVTAYARPELFLSFSLCFAITICIALFRFQKANVKVRAFFGFVVLWVIFIAWYYKTPFNSGDSGRSIKVFYQHFSMNYIQWYHLNLNWWLDWQEIISTNFKHPESISSILQYDGALFWQHIISNIKNYLAGMGSLCAQFLIPYDGKNILLMALGFLGVLLYLFPFRFQESTARIRSLLKQNATTLLFLLILVLPGILVCVYAYPRAHYLVINIPLLMLFMAIILSGLQTDTNSTKSKFALVLGIAFVCFAPGAGNFSFYQLERKEISLANAKTLSYLQQLSAKDTLRLFDLEGDLSSLLSGKYKGYTNAYLQQKTTSVFNFIEENDIDVIYVTPALLNYRPVKSDTAFQHLLNYPVTHQFYPEKTGNFTPYLLIKKR